MPAGAELSRHDPDVPDWESLSPDARRLAARMMEVFAGFLSHTDHQVGRVLDFLKEADEFDNTLIMLVSDNGASAEGGPGGTTNELQFFNNASEPLEDSLRAIGELGGPTTFNHYPWGWTWAGNTPFRRWKRETYRGGACDPFLVSWPKGIKARGEIRAQYAHIVDMVPTVLEALAIEAPAAIRGVTQSPIHGVSFAATFDDPAAATRHHTQYFEMFGHRAIDHDGWRAVCPWPGPSFAEAGQPFGAAITAATLTDLDAHHWELYDVAADPAENHNLAGKHQDTVGPRIPNRPHAITADVDIPAAGAEGVLLSQGTGVGGWSFYLADGKLHYAHNYVRRALYHVSSPDTVPAGRHQLRFEFEPTGRPDFAQGKGAPGRAQLYVDSHLVAQAEFPVTTPVAFNPGGLTCGANPGTPVTPDYQAPFRFTGTLHTVTVDLSGDLVTDTEAEMRMAMSRQ